MRKDATICGESKDAVGKWTGYYKKEQAEGFRYNPGYCGGSHLYSCAITQNLL